MLLLDNTNSINYLFSWCFWDLVVDLRFGLVVIGVLLCLGKFRDLVIWDRGQFEWSVS